MSETRSPWPLIFGYIASSSSHACSTIRHYAIMLLSSTPSLSSENIHFQPILNIHSPMKRNHSLLEYTRNNDSQVAYTLKLAYRKLTRRDISFLKIKALEVRVLSSSWAFFDKVLLNDILKAAVWNRSSTFSKFCLRDMS